MLSRVVVAAVAGSALWAAAPAQSDPFPGSEWPRAEPGALGIDGAPLAMLDAAVKRSEYGQIDHLFVVRRGHAVLDARYANDYEALSRGQVSPLGCGWQSCDDPADTEDEFNYLHPDMHPYYRRGSVHTLQSVTKSITATVIGAAIHNGAPIDADDPILGYLGDYDLSAIDPGLRQVRLADVLTMRSGIEWHENDRPLDETNTTYQIEHSLDWVQFTLQQPMDAKPGERWVYNSGGSQLLSAVIRQATGRTAAEYAEAHLFGPLGIDEYYWKHTPAGLPDTLGGLYLEAPDLARVGYLMLRDGVWDGDRILPEGWVRTATARHAEDINGAGWGYGYQWWRPDTRGVEIWAGLGFGGQYLLVLPEHDIVAVATGWNLFDPLGRTVLSGLVDALLDAVD